MSDETLLSGAQDNTEAQGDAGQSDAAADTEAPDDADAGAEGGGGDDAAESADADAGSGKDDADGEGSEDGDEGAPEEYEAFNLPDGMELDEQALEAAAPIFKELGLSQDNAQKLVSAYADIMKAQSDARMDVWNSTQESWKKATIEHKEYGGDKLDESLGLASKAIDAVFGKKPSAPKADDTKAVEAYEAHPGIQFRRHLEQTGMGNNPFVFELLVKFGELVGEDGFVQGGNAAGGGRDRAEVLYPDAKS